MPNLCQSNPARAQRDATMAAMRVQGHTVREIAQAVGVDKSTVSRSLSTEAAREIIEQGTANLIAAVPDAVAVIKGRLRNEDDPGLQMRAAERILGITGIDGSRTPSQLIQNIYIDQRQQVIDPQVLQALGDYFRQQEDEVIDAEFEDNTSI